MYCDGSTFDAAAYPKLYTVLKTNVLPNLVGRFLEGNAVGGTSVSAGLPNIVGNLGGIKYGAWTGYRPTSGAFTEMVFYEGNQASTGGGGTLCWYYNFNASKYNPIYSDSVHTVQPASVTVRYYIRAQ